MKFTYGFLKILILFNKMYNNFVRNIGFYKLLTTFKTNISKL